MTDLVPIDRVFHALADPNRRAILERLGTAPLSATLLAEPLGVTVAAVVQHLQILEAGGLIRTEKVGRVRTCRLHPAGLSAAEQWFRDRRSEWEQRFDRLGELLAADEDA